MLDTERPFNLLEISIKACYQPRQIRNGNEVCTQLFVCFKSEGDQPKEETRSQVNKLLLVIGPLRASVYPPVSQVLLLLT